MAREKNPMNPLHFFRCPMELDDQIHRAYGRVLATGKKLQKSAYIAHLIEMGLSIPDPWQKENIQRETTNK